MKETWSAGWEVTIGYSLWGIDSRRSSSGGRCDRQDYGCNRGPGMKSTEDMLNKRELEEKTLAKVLKNRTTKSDHLEGVTRATCAELPGRYCSLTTVDPLIENAPNPWTKLRPIPSAAVLETLRTSQLGVLSLRVFS